MLDDSSPGRPVPDVEPRSRVWDAVAVSAALLVAVAVVLAVVGGACVRPAAVTSSAVARRSPPVLTRAPNVATAETPPLGQITTVSHDSERPRHPGASEDERAKNRLGDLVVP